MTPAIKNGQFPRFVREVRCHHRTLDAKLDWLEDVICGVFLPGLNEFEKEEVLNEVGERVEDMK